MDYLSALNEKQLEAVTATEGYLRVIAGAGSGKTKLLVSRYAYLVKEYGINSAMTECIYKPIALTDSSTPKRIRTAIMRAIEIAWDRGDLDILQSFFGYTVSNTKGKPTNSEFIALLADKLNLWMNVHGVTL
ncbi:MAG: UvrD-helicase domain-containing protein [Oscillospiraceae bacterium]|nr:UvrD-helicase domain-containing protein [Oscillospiraceae bacterium]